ncbi:ribokinase [Vibrio gazogenes]|uniref:Ribokinase n=1 Tax=Vibrio gazogenes DSM 21264 = NBRC 103151 TaxID=1123492 RepID=A0A1M4XW17_VIBGA|nr:ribokinase [Vibrio gazogenes]USP12861.1 ribokinase [Vibrio gazogenes]SHE97691.1 ribokinase [Vibrio gazogenes DSM 21264] [Vibrio gazogenes DSM 21264 = NBRC 103151]SJN57888.1 Ribokinase [Vibrio gazogenes]
MYKELRQERIIQLLRQQGQATVEFLSLHLGVTKETIRTDLSKLQQDGVLIRHHGGASLKKHLLQNELQQDKSLDISHLMRTHHRNRTVNSQRALSAEMIGKVCVFGAFNVDIVARVDRFPKNGETLVAENTTFGPGGKGANQAIAAHAAGARVHFATKVGKDQFSQFAKNHFDACGMESFSIYETDQAATGSAVIYVNDAGENFIAICPGANLLVTDEEVAELIPYLTESKVLLVQLENNFDAIDGVMKLAKGLNVTVILNPAPYLPQVDRFFANTDIITPNETEASQISGVEITDVESAKQAARIIHERGVQNIIITMGKQGVVLFDGQQCSHIPSYSAVVVDTTGAGDAFNGALAAALAKGKSLTQAAYYATAFASLSVEREGAANMPNNALVEARMLQQQVTVIAI